jgi:hypothetical protein
MSFGDRAVRIEAVLSAHNGTTTHLETGLVGAEGAHLAVTKRPIMERQSLIVPALAALLIGRAWPTWGNHGSGRVSGRIKQ